ncbi:DUF898 family protein [Enterobacteriaceae bacterium RIT691]|nr:DUF898 family protein [Enterobacteriaceae bacterium RIT691]
MVGIEQAAAPSQHKFVFHGKVGRFFIIFLVNLLLTIVTLGIYLPWALVKIRRYIYENMELNGVRFRYNATGGALFLSLFLLMFFFIFATVICSSVNPAFSSFPVIVLIVLSPLMAVKGLRYQAMMTTLNNVRFGFHCRTGQAMWVMLGLPVALGVASIIFLYLFNIILGQPSDLTTLIAHMVLMAVAGLLLIGAVNGICYGKWMQLLGKNARFGTQPFDITVSLKRCLKVGVLSMLILLPFIVVIGKIIAPLYEQFAFAVAFGMMDAQSQQTLVAQYLSEITMSYLLYFVGAILAATFAMTALRNMFINGLTLGNTLHFRSSITFIAMLQQIVVLALVSMVTMGLAYPWAKIRFIRYLANHTLVEGDLNALELVDSDEENDTGLLAAISRGVVPAMPFI